jgi:hypothetical protein
VYSEGFISNHRFVALARKLFYFGSWEHLRDRRGFNFTSGVPTDKMRAGDFSEVRRRTDRSSCSITRSLVLVVRAATCSRTSPFRQT